MEPSVYTIVIASNGVGPTRRYYVPSAWIKGAIALAFLLVLLTSAVAIDYVGLLPKAREHQQLASENRDLIKKTENLHERLLVRNREVKKFKSLLEKLRHITALVGGGEHVDQPQGGAAREPAGLPILAEPMSIVYLAEETLSEAQKREQEMATLWDLLSDRQSFLAATPTLKPTNGYFSSPFGLRIHPISRRPLLHAGIDIAAPYGTPVIATADGVISYAGYEVGYGNVVSIDHGYGVLTRYAHNSKIFVRTGQKVQRWDRIAAVGSTGHSTGPHVHYEVIVKGMPVDPMSYILQDD